MHPVPTLAKCFHHMCRNGNGFEIPGDHVLKEMFDLYTGDVVVGGRSTGRSPSWVKEEKRMGDSPGQEG